MREMRKYRDYLIEELSDPEEAIAHLQIALEEYQKDGDTFVFLRALQSVIEAQGGNNELAPHVYLLRGFVYQLQKEYDCAIEDFTKAIELNPNYADAYYNRGLAYQSKGEVDRTIEDFTKAIELNPNYADAYYNRGLAYYDKGEHGRVIEDFTKVIELKPDDAIVYNNRGVAYSKKGEYDSALADFTRR